MIGDYYIHICSGTIWGAIFYEIESKFPEQCKMGNWGMIIAIMPSFLTATLLKKLRNKIICPVSLAGIGGDIAKMGAYYKSRSMKEKIFYIGISAVTVLALVY